MEEEAKTDSLALECFMSDHQGFFGSIKNSTRDFVVTEINISGQLVTETTLLEHVTPQLSDGSGQVCLGGELKIEGQVSTLTTDCASEETDSTPGELDCAVVDCRNSDTTAACDDVYDLEGVLGHAVNEALEQFAASARDAPRLVETAKSAELSLGMFPEKHQRALVHRAVRHFFPFLMTLTNKTEVLVKEDPDYEELARLVSEEEAEDFFRFIDAKVPNASFTFAQDDSKEHRKALHHFLSKRFGKLVETKSFSDVAGHGLQKTSITVRFRARSKPGKKRTATDCQEECAIYTGFTLRKENLETLEAIGYMAALLGVLPSDFTYAGIKDKRALTHQSMVVKKISPERLTQKSPEFEKKGIQLSHIQPVSQPLHLGRLRGNRFQLVVRDLRPHGPGSGADLPRLVREALDNVEARGFVNAYGPQRFGAGQGVKADQVGLALLKGEMVTAVRLFFTPDDGDDLQNRAKNHFLQTGNAKESLALMPGHKVRERLMLRALHRYGTGREGCARGWLSLPHGTRAFYVHAYCSRVWNGAAACRLRRLGRGAAALRGDLVWTREGRGRGQGGEQTPQKVHVVTAAEEAEGVFSLSQVVLPMPGNAVKYPENALGPWYRERLERDGLRDCRFRVTPLKLNVPGCYRPLLAYPRNLTRRLQGVPGGGPAERDDPLAPPAGPSLALSFDLDASCYATVCLREIMKCDP
ncbi:pseudouridylate synthase 7 homolog-like protein [Anguilla anguilla]|uniref:pseudouridylate synthase 7 homolog-like protein n=1 Tax=Anguilla anguilla TaxID=7936 RepID=UPI0015B10AD5|nr:pseudouridylate synthase 7 homolog-like protein [Anguilla anguilla]XP_035258197.1 pseudouridylate synthase 7 homolog-like protein [Anguilla anguilla]XP_035258198.1 pseudouridylate synthase 7 homolog-like protein [Anguilla anguilla]XP_035258199.1 pseudouridylate synthase 7 homolog-like protein [Anguilla anguilla]XP_035258200.1 pseudouridylate synthase 7 homolog-like protein [Anguilla anguilla]